MDDNRIETAKNRVFQGGFGFGKNNPISLSTDNNHIYRVTGYSQIDDIVDCGYVRPKMGKAKGGHSGEVFWTQGNDKLYFYDKRPVIETTPDKLKDGQKGAISIDDLTAIHIFDEEQNRYINKLEEYKKAMKEKNEKSFTDRSELEKREYELIKQKNQMLTEQMKLQQENGLAMKYTNGFANTILLSILIFVFSIIIVMLIFNIFS